MLNEEARLSVPQAKRLLERLREREGGFQERMETLRLEDHAYFRSRYVELQAFLNQAIALGEPIDCSL